MGTAGNKSTIIKCKYNYQLCDEIIEEILSLLPINSLIKCRYVSKSWSSLISNVLCNHRRRIRTATVGLIGLHSSTLPPSSINVQRELRLIHPPSDDHPYKTTTTLMEQEDCQEEEKDWDDEVERYQINWFRKLLVLHGHREIAAAAAAATAEEDMMMMSVAKYMELYCETELLDSCNGLLFFRCSKFKVGHDTDPGELVVYYVCNPILNQWVALPDHYQQYYPKKMGSLLDYDDADHLYNTNVSCVLGFAFDGIQGHHYTVVSFSWQQLPAAAGTNDDDDDDDDDDTFIRCEIFSSETGRWRDHRAPILNLLSTSTSLYEGFGIKRGSRIRKCSLYRKGAIHWLFVSDYQYMLLFYLDKEVFEFIKLPQLPPVHDIDPTPRNWMVVKCLWESYNNGCLHFCSNAFSSNINQFQVWTYLDDDDDDWGSNDQKGTEHRWVFIQTVKFITLSQQYGIESPRQFVICMCNSSSSNNDNGTTTTTTTLIVPCGLHRDMQAVYLPTMLTVFSCGLERKRRVVLWSFNNMSSTAKKEGYSNIKRPLKGILYPYLFNLVELPTIS